MSIIKKLEIQDDEGKYMGGGRRTKVGYHSREGIGVMEYGDGSEYRGNWHNNKQHGKGIKTWASGANYDGEWKWDKQHGKGIYTWASGAKYDGEWEWDKQEGKGIKTWANGDKYEGEWMEDEQHGKGIFTWANGDKYDGEWTEGNKHGKGIFTWASGDKYDGEWMAGNKHGKGIKTWANGDKYDGEWKWDKQEGKGIKTWADGDKYDGEWMEGIAVIIRKMEGEAPSAKRMNGTHRKRQLAIEGATQSDRKEKIRKVYHDLDAKCGARPPTEYMEYNEDGTESDYTRVKWNCKKFRADSKETHGMSRDEFEMWIALRNARGGGGVFRLAK